MNITDEDDDNITIEEDGFCARCMTEHSDGICPRAKKIPFEHAMDTHRNDATAAFKKLVLQILNKNSGGMKFLEFLVDYHCISQETHSELVLSPDQLEVSLRALTPEVQVLDYSWDMGGNTRRSKMFIYTP